MVGRAVYPALFGALIRSFPLFRRVVPPLQYFSTPYRVPLDRKSKLAVEDSRLVPPWATVDPHGPSPGRVAGERGSAWSTLSRVLRPVCCLYVSLRNPHLHCCSVATFARLKAPFARLKALLYNSTLRVVQTQTFQAPTHSSRAPPCAAPPWHGSRAPDPPPWHPRQHAFAHRCSLAPFCASPRHALCPRLNRLGDTP